MNLVLVLVLVLVLDFLCPVGGFMRRETIWQLLAGWYSLAWRRAA
jgi:hypothetical protein